MEQMLKKLMADLFEIKEDEITDESSMDNIENWDSLSHLRLIASIEELFKTSMSTDEMVEMTSFANTKRILRAKGIET